jgi:hypothetical protein
MAPPDPRAGLDPVYILAICQHTAAVGGHRPVTVTSATGGIRVRAPSRRAALHMDAALTLIGYETACADSRWHWQLTVSGWNAARLEARLAAMRAVVTQLSADPTATAATAVAHYRRQPRRRSPDERADMALARTSQQLRASVAAHCGLSVPREPAILPADIGNALRLRAIWILEQTIEDLIDAHLRAARRALALFSSLRRQAPDDLAHNAAIRMAASAVVDLPPPWPRDPAAALPPPLWPSRPARPSAAPGESRPPAARPCDHAARDQPGAATNSATAPGITPTGMGGTPSARQQPDTQHIRPGPGRHR